MLSVCMAVYNGSLFLLPQLLSMLPQLDSNDEVIIVDDNSQDGSLELIRGIDDKRIKIIVNPENQGVIRSFETAIRFSSGSYIFLCDQDDIWMPDKIETMMNEFGRSGALLIVSDAYIMDGYEIKLDTFYDVKGGGSGFFKNAIRNSFIGCCMAFKSDLKLYVLPFPKSIPMHDQWIGLIAEMHGHVEFIPERLLVYRRHSNNVTELNAVNVPSIIMKRIALVKTFYKYYLRRSAVP